MSFEMEIRSQDLKYDKYEYSPVMKKLLEIDVLKRVLDKYSDKQRFYEVLKRNIDPANLDKRSVEIAMKETLGEFLVDKGDSIYTEDIEKIGKELFGDEEYSKRFILPK